MAPGAAGVALSAGLPPAAVPAVFTAWHPYVGSATSCTLAAPVAGAEAGGWGLGWGVLLSLWLQPTLRHCSGKGTAGASAELGLLVLTPSVCLAVPGGEEKGTGSHAPPQPGKTQRETGF